MIALVREPCKGGPLYSQDKLTDSFIEHVFETI